MRRAVRKLIVASHANGDVQAVEKLAKVAQELEADAIALVGDLAPKSATPRDYGKLFKALAEANLPTFFVPGPDDVPIYEYLREAANIEIVYSHLHGVHGTFCVAPGYVIFSGMGGDIIDDPATVREEVETLRYPAWEVEYRLKVLNELRDYQKIFLFTTPPAHKGLKEPGSQELAEFIKTYNPRLVVVRGKEPQQEMLGVSMVAVPGYLCEGNYAFVNLLEHTFRAGKLD